MSAARQSDISMFLRVDVRELATILAALRFYQDENLQGPEPIADKVIGELASDGGTLAPLDWREVDQLCQKLNLDAQPAGVNIEPPPRQSGPEPLFRVIYVIDVSASDAQAAARQVYRLMTDPRSQPPLLHVVDASAAVCDVDLSPP